MKLNLTLAAIITLINSCGDALEPRTTKAVNLGSSPQAATTVTTTTTTPVTTIAPTPIGVTASLNSAPTHYTFMVTPHAAECADAFIRSGVPLPDNTVARSLIIENYATSGFAIQDLQTTTYPILNVIYAKTKFSSVTLQLLNKVGFYCIVENEACASTVNIQLSCSAQMTSIEPITVSNGGASGGFFGMIFSSFNRGSQIIQSQCIP